MSIEQKLERIREEVSVCRRCGLGKGRTKSVPGEGPAQVEIMFIGEAPGFYEDRQGKPFVGQAGQFLDELLKAAGLSREQVFITNVVKCRPPSNRDPLPEELSACQEYLDEQIRLLNPKVIVTLGRISMGKFIERGRIGIIHGRAHNVEGKKVVTMYHPAAALHQPALRQTLIEDFARLKKFIGAGAPSAQTDRAVEGGPEQTPIQKQTNEIGVSQIDINLKKEDSSVRVSSDEPIREDSKPELPPEQLSLF